MNCNWTHPVIVAIGFYVLSTIIQSFYTENVQHPNFQNGHPFSTSQAKCCLTLNLHVTVYNHDYILHPVTELIQKKNVGYMK